MSSANTRRPAPLTPQPTYAAAGKAAALQFRGRRRKYVVNFPLLLVSALTAGGAFAASWWWHAYQVQRNAKTLLAQANEYEQRENWAAAAQALRQFIRFQPDDVAARVRLATAVDQLADTPAGKRQALQFYAVAAGLAPADNEIRSRHLELLLEVGDPDGALQRADELLQLLPTDAGARRARALALYERYRIKAERSADRVREALVAANLADPTDAIVATRLARFYRKELNQPTEGERQQLADAVMDALVESSQADVNSLVSRHLYRVEFGLSGAREDLEQAQAADVDKQEPAVAMAAGQMYFEAGKWDAAQESFQRAIELRPEHPQGYLMLGQVYHRQGLGLQAIEAWQRGLDATGGQDLNLQAQIAAVQIEQRNVADLKPALDRMERQIAWLFGPEQTAWSSVLYGLRADLALDRQDYSAAAPLLKRILALRQGDALSETKVASDARVYAQLGLCYSQLRLWDQAGAAYQSAAELQPRSIEHRLAAAQCWERAGWIDEAVRHYEQAAAAAPENAAAAQALADAALRQQLLLPAASREWRLFHEALVKAQSAAPDAAMTKLLAAEGLLAAGRLDEAAEQFAALDAKLLDAPELAQRLAFDYERMGAAAKADALLTQLKDRLGNSAAVLLLQANLLFRRQQEADAIGALAAGLHHLPEAERGPLRYRLALLHAAGGELGLARAELESLSAEAPDDPRPIQLLIELDLQGGNLTEAGALIDRLQSLEQTRGDSAWRYYRAQMLLAQASRTADASARKQLLEEAQQHEQQLESMRPHWAHTYLLKGRLAQVKSKPDEEKAIQAYAQAIRLGERRTPVYQELISLLFRHARIAEADAYLEHLREMNRLPASLIPLAVVADLWEGNLTRAVDTARREAERLPQDSAAHLRLGQLLALPEAQTQPTEARLAEAEAELKRGRDLAPDDPSGWSALLAFYRHRNQLEAAKQLLNEVERRQVFAEADRAFFLAQGCALLDDREAAGAHYHRAVKLSLERPAVLLQAAQFFWRSEPERAERYLRRAVEIEPGPTTAKRLLAMFLAARGRDQQDLEEAWSLLDSDASNGAAHVADGRLKAVLRLHQGGTEAREQARQMLEAAAADSTQAKSLDRLLLARLYEAQNQLGKARDQLESLTNLERPDPASLAVYADYLLRTALGQAAALERVGKLLDQLARVEPETSHFRSLALRARWLKQMHQEPKVVELGEKLLAHYDQPPQQANRAETLIRLAGLYAELDINDAADACYRRAVKLSPELYPELAAWLARHGRGREAVMLCVRRAADDSSSRPAIALAAALTVANSAIENRPQAEQLIRDGLARHPDDRELLFNVASLRFMAGDNQEAIRMLRRGLELEPNDAAMLNNLAWALCEAPDATQEAQVCAERALKLVGNQPELLDTKGWVLLRQHRPEDAESLFRDVLFRSPAEPKFRFHLALSLKAQGKRAEAAEALARARQDRLSAQLLSPAEQSELAKLDRSAP